MSIITIDPNRCKKDGICTKVCPATIFVQREQLTIPTLVEEEHCISCGQCVAVCPQGAVSHVDFPPGSVKQICFEMIPTAEQVTELLKTRRSIRSFREKPIERGLIERIIDGARFAPSGHNAQSTEFLAVHDKAVLEQVSALTVQYLEFEIKRFSNPIFRTMVVMANRELAQSGLDELPGFKRMIQRFKAGMDPILFHAPLLLVFHARRKVGFADVNASLALQNASLVAHSLGIGHFFAGWVISACKAPMAQEWARRIPRLLGIPPENNIYGALALGYPVPKFKNWMEKKPAQVKWL